MLTVTLVMCLLLTSCGNAASKPTVPEEVTEITTLSTSEEPISNGFARADVDYVPLYHEADLDSTVIARISPGEPLAVYQMLQGWFRVEFDGMQGFVPADYITFQKPSETKQATTVPTSAQQETTEVLDDEREMNSETKEDPEELSRALQIYVDDLKQETTGAQDKSNFDPDALVIKAGNDSEFNDLTESTKGTEYKTAVRYFATEPTTEYIERPKCYVYVNNDDFWNDFTIDVEGDWDYYDYHITYETCHNGYHYQEKWGRSREKVMKFELPSYINILLLSVQVTTGKIRKRQRKCFALSLPGSLVGTGCM